MTTHAYDVIVLGSGAAGMTAALVAATEGLDVCVLEKAPYVGGTTAWSGGMVWAPGSRAAREAGFDDSPGRVRAYLDGAVPGSADDSRMAAFLRAAPAAVDYLADRTFVSLRPVPLYPDYHPALPGATEAGRVLEPEPFDASALGERLRLLLRPIPEFGVLGDMMIARADLPHFRDARRSVRSLERVVRLLARHALEKARHGRGTSLVLGNALAARLFASVLDAGVELRTDTHVSRLLTGADGAVRGVVLAGGAVLGARRGVVLATGGFTHDTERRERYLPTLRDEDSVTVGGATGDGARLAEAIGGRFTECSRDNGFWCAVSSFMRADGSRAVFPHTVTDRAKPGLIAVDRRGARFVNEAVSYHEFGRAMLANADGADESALLVCDARFIRRYGLGAVKPMQVGIRDFVDQGYLLRAPTLGRMEALAGLPAGTLIETVETYNRGARLGEDREFGRGGDAYQRFLGDAAVTPNPCVAPIEHPPFFAVEIRPGDIGAAAGLATDASARVLDAGSHPIPGLYACGADMRSVMEGSYPGPGITLGPALAFGYLAAMDLARRPDAPRPDVWPRPRKGAGPADATAAPSAQRPQPSSRNRI